MSSNSLKEGEKEKIPAGNPFGDNVSVKVIPGVVVQKSVSTLETPPSSPPCNSFLGFPGSFLSRSLGRQRTVSEGAGVSVSVDLGPWLKDGDNISEVRAARIRRNSSREAEEAMAAGLSKADIHMPPV